MVRRSSEASDWSHSSYHLLCDKFATDVVDLSNAGVLTAPTPFISTLTPSSMQARSLARRF